MSTAYHRQVFVSPNLEPVPQACLAGRSATAGQPLREASASLVDLLVADLSEWIDCSWAVAMSSFHGVLAPLCVHGPQLELQACLNHTASLLSRDPELQFADGEASRDGEVTRNGIPQLVVPIRVSGGLRVVLAFGPKRGTSGYSAADRELVVEAGAQIANLLENERLACRMAANAENLNRMRLDLKTAGDVQNRLLPRRLTHIPNLDYYGESRPAADLGGDFFDFIPLAGNALVASVGDVAGTGVSAAIIMAGLQAFERGLTAKEDGTPSGVVRELNRILYEVSPDNLFATLFYARIDPARGRLDYVSAGHDAVLLIRKHASAVHRLESTGTVLGLSTRASFQQRTVTVEPGDVMVAFTDGITDAQDAEGRELREEGLIEVVWRYRDARAGDMVGRIMDAVDRFTDSSVRTDDRTVAVVRITGTAEKEVSADRVANLAFAAA
jgi:sigma-B regulation protein RsbU (phosphoserine phosphatase)